jgi:predicted transcriptional regulator
LPLSTANLHLGILEKAGLIHTSLQPANRGLQKMCSRVFDQINILLPPSPDTEEIHIEEVSMPLGAYVNFKVTPTCGLSSEQSIIGYLDHPGSFYEPEHIFAQHLWFRSGFVEYIFPNHLSNNDHLEEIELSFEACSELPNYNLNWPSDISVWINHVELGVWTSPADFGGVRGSLTPDWVNLESTQYGLLKIWKVTSTGCFIDGVRASTVTLSDLNIRIETPIVLRIGVKEDAHNVGGINLFGKKFGNYPQDILLKFRTKKNIPGHKE